MPIAIKTLAAALLLLKAQAAPTRVFPVIERIGAAPAIGDPAPPASGGAPQAPLFPAREPLSVRQKPAPKVSAPRAAARLRAPRAEDIARKPLETLKASARDFFAGSGGIDESEFLAGHYEEAGAKPGKPLPRQAGNHSYLLVPGFFWDAIPTYFQPNLRRLRSLGLDASLVRTRPLGTSSANAPLLRAAIEACEKPVVILAHSKGGIDVLEALRRFPELQGKVARIVVIQTPYFGTPIADWAMNKPWLHGAALAFGRLLNPARLFRVNPFFKAETIKELSCQSRRGACAPALRPEIGFYSLATQLSSPASARALTRVAAGMLKALSGLDNDGLVAAAHAIVPGSRFALLDNVAHQELIADPSFWRRRAFGVKGQHPALAEDMTEAIVRWIFARRK